MNFCKHFAILLCFSLLSSVNYAQKYSFKNVGAKQGVSSLEITDIIQDKEGFIWFTTLAGVVKYDGRLLKTYKTKNGLSGNLTRNLFEDSKGRLWCSTWGQGINYIENDSIHAFKGDDFPWHGAGHFTEDDEGTIWIAGLDDIVSFKDGRFEYYDSLHTIKNIVNVQYRDDTLWLATITKGIFAYDLNTKTYINYTTDNGLKNNICYSIFLDSENDLWFGCYGGVSRFSNGKFESFSITEDHNKNRVEKIVEDDEGVLWFALYGNGIAKWDKKNNQLIQLYSTKNGIDHPYGNAILIDRDKNVWLATNGNGVYMLNDESIQVYDKDYGLPTNRINSFNIKNDHIQLLTFDGGEVLLYEDTIIQNIIKFDDYIVSINTSSELNDTIWYGTSSGIRYKSKKNDKFEIAKSLPPITNNSHTSIIYNNKVFFGGIESYFTINASKINYFREKRGYINQIVNPVKFVTDKNGGLWSANMTSIAYLKNDSVHILKPGDDFKYFYNDATSYDDKLFFIGENKLVKIEFINGDTIATHLNVLDQLKIDKANSIVINNDTVWIAFSQGVAFFNYSEIESQNISYTKLMSEDGFPSDGGHEVKVDHNGICWVVTYEGLVKIDLSKKNNFISNPKVYLTDVELFSEKSDSISISHLNYNQNHITFKWSSIGFNNPQNIEFSYFLKGFDESWSKPSTDLKTTYKKLPPGNYSFIVKARYKNKTWSNELNLIQFSISPPFWKTLWFGLLIGVLLIVFLVSIIYNIFITKKQKTILEEFSKELIQSQEDERKKISKDLHDSVGQLLLFVKNKLQASDSQNEGLVTELDSALDEVRQISRQLHPYQLEKFGLTKAIELLADKASESTQVFFSEELDNIDNVLSKDKELAIYRIVQECINNVVKHAQAKSAKIELEKQDKQIKLVIKDNGLGFKSKVILAGKKHSFGLTGIIERVKILNGGITIHSSESGTEIKIYIPIL